MSTLFLAILATAMAAPPDDPTTHALVAAVERHRSELRLPDAPPIHLLRYRAVQVAIQRAEASFGGLRLERTEHEGRLGVEVRVGTPTFDSGGFAGLENGFDTAWTGTTPSPEALQWVAWRLTDGAYKGAVEQYARKVAQFRPPTDYPGDYAVLGGHVEDQGASPKFTSDLAAQSTSISSMYADFPWLEIGEVHATAYAAEQHLVDSEGSRLRLPETACAVRAVARARATDGLPITADRLWIAEDCGNLPAADAMREAARADARELEQAVQHSLWPREYVGPVIFEGTAAADLMRYLLTPELEGTPPLISFETWLGAWGGASTGGAVLGRRVLPPGWSVRDLPYSAFDAEGTPTGERRLIEDGMVRDLLTSRIPRRDRATVGGSARGSLGEPAQGRASRLVVEAPHTMSRERLYRRALQAGRRYECRCVAIVRRLQDPEAMGLDAEPVSADSVGPLPPPLSVVLRYADGREETFRGVRFAGASRFVLRDIAGASGQTTHEFLAPLSSAAAWGYTGILDGLRSAVTTPSVWVEEMELIPSSGDIRSLPVLPPPTAGP
jgi:hypothetical protein